ncbi:MAG: DUF4157 domain-containing protein [Leptolyngbyaceae cyanobacterium HOT.MB2.61]|nr:DUF4157 domain-containing protein [Leptolyngbyaceae cyanobacterium HOT.MB2.61]
MQWQYLLKSKAGSDNSQIQITQVAQSPHPILQLQAAVGNEAVNHLLKKPPGHHEPTPATDFFRGLSHEFMQQSGGQPIADGIRQSMEQRLDTDLSDVNVHTDAKADWLNRSLNSLAFTSQRDIFFRQNAYNPGHPTGQKLLAHELAHVVQQTQGQVQPTQQINGVAVNDNSELEPEADAIANQIAQTRQPSAADQNHAFNPIETGLNTHPAQSLAANSQSVVQRMVIPRDAVGLEKDLDTDSPDYPDEIKKIKDPQILEKIISYTQKHKKTPEDEWSLVFPSNQKEEIPNLIKEINRLANEAAISIGMKPSSDTGDLQETVAEIIKESGYGEAIDWLKLYIENSKKLPEAIESVDKANRRLEEIEAKLDVWLGKYGARATAEANKVNLGDSIEGRKITVDEKTKKLLGKTFKTKQEFGRPGKLDEPLGKGDNLFDFLKKKRKDKQDKLLRDQKQVKKDIKSPSLKINDKVTVDGAKVLKWFNEVTRVELSQFYDSSKAPAKAIAADRRLENITLDSKNWLDAWAQLAWKDTWARSSDPAYGKPKGVAKTFPLIGKLNLGGKAYAVEDKLWVKPEGQDKATRYNVMGEELGKKKTAAKRAENIRKVIKGDLMGVDAHEQEAALAMLGAETARNPRSYGVGLMLLDMVENDITYGSGKAYTWDKILGSQPHPGESRKTFETRKTAATPEKSSRWAKMFGAVSAYAPQFEDKPFVSLWAGKWSMSPSASLSLGAPSLAIPAKAEDLNTVQYKELKTILNWYINLMQGVELDVNDEKEAETVLKKLFQMRLQSTDKFTNEMLKQKDDWT